MNRKHISGQPVLQTGSLADIAFLMLTFFLITTQITHEKGLILILPQPLNNTVAPVHKRNLFTLQINSVDRYLVNGELRSALTGVRDEIKTFVLNNGLKPELSDRPEKAVISLKADRGTSHRAFIAALDEIQAAYYELYAQQAGIDAERFRTLDLSNPEERVLYEKGRKGIPMNISIAE
ncbi:MAG: biopolymer transporter ExbD [Cyclobacteriaceae bacterium]|nr:biopolymer transporter ExbD [Cyclobacteriaceae bacterium]